MHAACVPVETLKNLVLGGIASFCIVDGTKVRWIHCTASDHSVLWTPLMPILLSLKVSQRDLGNNFLVEGTSLGEPRAKVVTELLQELNESVAGSYVEEAPEMLLASNPSFFSDFTLVIATQVGAG